MKALHADLANRHITECWLAYSAPPNPADFQIPCKRLPTLFSMLLDTGQQQAIPEQIQGPVFVSSEDFRVAVPRQNSIRPEKSKS